MKELIKEKITSDIDRILKNKNLSFNDQLNGVIKYLHKLKDKCDWVYFWSIEKRWIEERLEKKDLTERIDSAVESIMKKMIKDFIED